MGHKYVLGNFEVPCAENRQQGMVPSVGLLHARGDGKSDDFSPRAPFGQAGNRIYNRSLSHAA